MKNIIITGASRGIGYYTALEFARQGHTVLAIARSRNALQNLAAESEARGNIHPLALDLSTDYSTDILLRSFKDIDILINNAGSIVNKPFTEISDEELRMVYEVNVFSPFRMVQRLMPYFNKDAHIINIGSVGGVNGTQKFPGLSAYSSSKAALACLAECWQAEFEGSGFAFNSLALGAVQTEMLAQAFPGYQAPVSPREMAAYIVRFALFEHEVIRGKTVLVSRSNP